MKAILVNDDRRLRWDDVPDPVMGEDDCLIKIEAAAVNRADLMQREGDYPPPPGCPEWMGLEIAGTIVDIADGAKKKSRWKVGDRVCALLGGGGYAQYANVKYDMLMPVPENCTVTEAAAIPEAFATAYLNLFIEGRMKAGDTVLVTGGNSGLASVIIPMARAFGARVITTVRNDAKAEAVSHLKADRVIVTDREDLAAALREELDAGHPVDIAIDCLGGDVMGRCLALSCPRGEVDNDSRACRGEDRDRSQEHLCKKRADNRQYAPLPRSGGEGGNSVLPCPRCLGKGQLRRDTSDDIQSSSDNRSGGGSRSSLHLTECRQGCYDG